MSDEQDAVNLPSTTDPQPSVFPPGWSKEMIQYHAEQASLGGVCAITVGNLVVLSNAIISNPESRSRSVQEIFRERFLDVSVQTNAPEKKWKRKQKNNQPEDLFYPISDPIILERSGIDIEFGIRGKELGLFILGEKFIPLIRLVEFTKPKDVVTATDATPQCSFAEINTDVLKLVGDPIVITAQDENNTLVAMLADDLTFHVTHDVLRAIQECLDLDSSTPLNQRVTRVDSLLGFEKVVLNTLDLDQEIDLHQELTIRRAMSHIKDTAQLGVEIPLHKQHIPNSDDPSCAFDRESFVTFAGDGSFVLRETATFPHLPYSERTDVSRFYFDRNVGSVSYVGDNLDEPEYVKILDYAYGIVAYDQELISAISIVNASERANGLMHYNRRHAQNRTLEDKALDAIECILGSELAASELVYGEDKPDPRINPRNRLGVCLRKTLPIQTNSRSVENHTFISGKGLVYLAQSLRGIDSARAEKIRENLLFLSGWAKQGGYFQQREIHNAILESYAGIDSEAAWSMRELYMEERQHLHDSQQFYIDERTKRTIGLSLVGLTSDRANEMREGLISKTSYENFTVSITGHNDEYAWAAREKLVDEITIHADYLVLESLAGIDTERAQEMRERLKASIEKDVQRRVRNRASKSQLKAGIRNSLSRSLVGVNSLSASFQCRLLDLNQQLIAHTGSDSRAAWHARDRALKAGEHFDEVVLSLAGLTTPRAEKMREDIVEAFSHKKIGSPVDIHASIARSYVGSIEAFGAREFSLLQSVQTRVPVTAPISH